MPSLKQRMQERLNQEIFDFAKFAESTRYELAKNNWFEFKGHIPIPEIASAYDVSLHKLTVLIQEQISYELGVEIKNQAPEVEILYSEKYFEENYPKSSYNRCKMPYTLELYYFLKYPERLEEKHKQQQDEL